jgi:hypothetical protein
MKMPKYFVTLNLEVDINKVDNIDSIIDSFDLLGSAENTEVLEVSTEKAEEYEDDFEDEEY